MEFSRELREDVMSGEITVSFRLWRRPKVREGGQYPVGPVKIEVDSVELVPFASITAADIRRSGERDLQSLRQRAAHAGPITDDTLLYRVEFHLVEPAKPPQRDQPSAQRDSPSPRASPARPQQEPR
jgi:hypothetical protein